MWIGSSSGSSRRAADKQRFCVLVPDARSMSALRSESGSVRRVECLPTECSVLSNLLPFDANIRIEAECATCCHARLSTAAEVS